MGGLVVAAAKKDENPQNVITATASAAITATVTAAVAETATKTTTIIVAAAKKDNNPQNIAASAVVCHTAASAGR